MIAAMANRMLEEGPFVKIGLMGTPSTYSSANE